MKYQRVFFFKSKRRVGNCVRMFEEKWMFPKCDKKQIYRHSNIHLIGKLIQVKKETLGDLMCFINIKY